MLEFLVCDLGDPAATQMLKDVLYYVRLVMRVLQIFVPVALIIWGTVDMAKGVIAGDEKKIKDAKKPLIQRLIAAVIVFLLPWFVAVVVNFVGGDSSYVACYNEATTKPTFNNNTDPGKLPSVNTTTNQSTK